MPPRKKAYSATATTQLKKMRAALAKAKAAKAPAKARAVRAKSAPRTRSAAGMASTIGSTVGGLLSGPMGAKVGSSAGKLFSKITGFGDYKVSSNSILMGTDPPQFGTAGRGTLVKHREYIQDISGSTAFVNTSFPINPGLYQSFPWLASVAANYEEYAIRGMVFEFKSTSATALNSTNTALGTVIMSTNYNAYRPAFATKSEMENHEFCTSAKPSDSFTHPIECAVNENPLTVLYVRQGTVGDGDIRMYDLGNFQIATAGMQAVATIGELWVTYDVELLKPRLPTGSGAYADHWRLDVTGLAAGTPYGTNPALSSESNFGTTISGGLLILPYDSTNYDFLFLYEVTGAATALAVSPSYASGTALARQTVWVGNTELSIFQPAGTITTRLLYMAMVRFSSSAGAIPEVTRRITFAATGTFPAGITGGDLWVISINAPQASLLSRGMSRTLLEDVSRTSLCVSAPERAITLEEKDEPEDQDQDDLEDFIAYKKAKRAKARKAKASDDDIMIISSRTASNKGTPKTAS